jgi:hypothetical protein
MDLRSASNTAAVLTSAAAKPPRARARRVIAAPLRAAAIMTVMIAALALAPTPARAQQSSPGEGVATALGIAQTWRLQGWGAFSKQFALDGRSDVLLLVAPEQEAAGLQIMVAAAQLDALAILGDQLAERALLDGYLKRLFFKLGAQPERVVAWSCSMRGDASGELTSDPRSFGLQGEVFIEPDERGWWRACMVWDKTRGALLIGLAWQAGVDQPPAHPAALLNTVLLNTRFTSANP